MQKEEDIIYLDEEGYKDYLTKIDNLMINLGRVEERLSEKNKNSDFIDNYDDLSLYRKELKKQIRKKRDNISKIKIIEKQNNEDIMDVGDVVKILAYYDIDDIVEEVYELVTGDSNIHTNPEKLSINSPKGEVIYKSKIGDVGYYKVNKEKIKVEIKEKLNVKTLKKSI